MAVLPVLERVLSDSSQTWQGKPQRGCFLSAGTDESLYSIPGNLNTVSIRVKNGQFLYHV